LDYKLAGLSVEVSQCLQIPEVNLKRGQSLIDIIIYFLLGARHITGYSTISGWWL